MLENNLSKLVSFQTLTGNHSEVKRLYAWVKNELRGLPLFFKEEKSGGHYSLLITTRKTKKPELWLQAHIDVVPASKGMFKTQVIKGKMVGRGVFDMKFAAALYMELFKELGQNLRRYDLGIMFTSDEEVGGENGVRAMVEKGYVSQAVFLPDSGEDWKLERSAKGIVNLKVQSFGKSEHGSRPWAGKNAINALIEFLVELQKEFPLEPCNDLKHRHSTMNIGKIEGGLASNQVPDYAESLVNIRFVKRNGQNEIIKKVTAISKKYKGIRIEQPLLVGSYYADLENPYAKVLIKLVEKETKKPIQYKDSHGGSDAGHFAAKSIPVISIQPKGGDHHSEHEWIDLKSLHRFYKVLKEFVEITKLK